MNMDRNIWTGFVREPNESFWNLGLKNLGILVPPEAGAPFLKAQRE